MLSIEVRPRGKICAKDRIQKHRQVILSRSTNLPNHSISSLMAASSSIPPSTATTSVVRKSLLLSTNFSFPASSLSPSTKSPQRHIHRLLLASSSSSAVPSDIKPAKKETVYFDGGAHYGDLLANLILGLTILWLPLTLAAVSRAFNLRYRFTNLRVTVISGLTGEDRSDFSYKVIKDVQVVPRFIGEWGDIIITLKDGTKVDLRSVPKFREIAKYCLSMANQPAVLKESVMYERFVYGETKDDYAYKTARVYKTRETT